MRRFAWLAVAAGCSITSNMKTYDAPSSDDFRYVSSMLAGRCGSLDCHGQAGRNLRLYGKFGLRLARDSVPGREPDTQAEHDANYESVVSLEPEILANVTHDAGRDPERLTLIRKAQNLESHKGGNALDAGGHRCLTSWLSGAVDKKACFQASTLNAPPGFNGNGGTGGTGGTGGGGTGGSTGGSGGTGGSSLGGNGGTSTGGGGTGGTVASGGTGGTVASGGDGGTGGGVVCGPGDFWPCSNDPNCAPIAPSPPDHDQYAAVECLSCHSEFLFGGVVWLWSGNQGAEHVEVGVRWGTTFYYTCTDARGFYFVPTAGNPSPNWDEVETRMRAELGEKTMPPDKQHKPTCNETACHGDPLHELWAP